MLMCCSAWSLTAERARPLSMACKLLAQEDQRPPHIVCCAWSALRKTHREVVMAEGRLDAQRLPGGRQVIVLLQQADDHLPLRAESTLHHLWDTTQGSQLLLFADSQSMMSINEAQHSKVRAAICPTLLMPRVLVHADYLVSCAGPRASASVCNTGTWGSPIILGPGCAAASPAGPLCQRPRHRTPRRPAQQAAPLTCSTW